MAPGCGDERTQKAGSGFHLAVVIASIVQSMVFFSYVPILERREGKWFARLHPMFTSSLHMHKIKKKKVKREKKSYCSVLPSDNVQTA